MDNVTRRIRATLFSKQFITFVAIGIINTFNGTIVTKIVNERYINKFITH